MRSGDFKETYGELVALVDSPPVWLWSAVLVVALIAAPFVLNSYALSFLTIILITVVGALGLNILTGYTGLISLGHVGFLVTGAYAYAVLVSKYDMPSAGRLPRRRHRAGACQPDRRRAVAAAQGPLSRHHDAGVLLHHQHRDPGGALADQRRPRHFGAAAGDFRRQLRQRCRLHLSLPRLRRADAVRHAQHPPQPRRPRVCRDPRQRHRGPRHGHQSARLQAVRFRHLRLHHRPRRRAVWHLSVASSASRAFRSCSRSRRWRS